MSEPVPLTTPVIVAPDGTPARLPRDARCPNCGAGPDQRETSGMGEWHHVTCAACAYEFPKERAR